MMAPPPMPNMPARMPVTMPPAMMTAARKAISPKEMPPIM
jgi:hypothetical protein